MRWFGLLAVALTSACVGGPADGPPPAAAPGADAAAPDPVASCVTKRCEGAKDVDRCREDKCAETPETWALNPKQVSYSKGVLTVAVKVDHGSRQVGSTAVPRTEPAYVGVTAIRDDGEEIDLAIHTLFPGRFADEPLVVAEVGDGVRDIIFGLWDRKVEPCDSNRSGCKKFGFLLDGSLAAWPPRIYLDGQRQRLPPSQLTLKVEWAGGSAADAGRIITETTERLQRFVEAFDTEVVVEGPTLASAAIEQTVVIHADSHDAPMAAEIALPLKGRTEHVEDSAGLTLRLGGDPEAHTCATEHCASAASLLTCLTEHCL